MPALITFSVFTWRKQGLPQLAGFKHHVLYVVAHCTTPNVSFIVLRTNVNHIEKNEYSDIWCFFQMSGA
jgi:hypothetical protein